MTDWRAQEAEFRARVRDNGQPPPGSVLVPFTEIVAKPVRWAWRDRIALAKITALAGRPKIGTGLLYSHLIAQSRSASLTATSTVPGTRSSSPPRTTPETRSSPG